MKFDNKCGGELSRFVPETVCELAYLIPELTRMAVRRRSGVRLSRIPWLHCYSSAD